MDSNKLQLNLQPNGEEILECCGHIQGHYSIYIPDDSVLTENLVRHAHQLTLHGGLGLTMAEVREKYWTPRLRNLMKKVVKGRGDVNDIKQSRKLLLHQACFPWKEERDQVPSKS